MKLFVPLAVFYLFSIELSAQVGIGTSTPTYNLSLGGNSARTIGMERHSSSHGNSLTLLAGGAATSGTNLNGGNLIFSSGLSRGNGSSNILFRTFSSGASGSAENTATERMRITSSGNVLIGIDAETTGSRLAVKGILGILSSDNNLMAISSPTNQYFQIQTYGSKPFYINPVGNDIILSDEGQNAEGKVGIGTSTPSAKLEINAGAVNSSGLKFSNLNASSPVSNGATLGVDASGNVVTVNGSSFSPEFGTARLGGVGENIAAGNSLSLASVTISSTGTYLITYTMRVQCATGGQNQFAVGFLSLDNTNAIEGTEILGAFTGSQAFSDLGGSYSGSHVMTINTVPTTIYFRATAQNGGMSFPNDGNGRTKITYVKITP